MPRPADTQRSADSTGHVDFGVPSQPVQVEEQVCKCRAGFCCRRREEGQLEDECGRLPRVLRLDRMRCGKPQDEGRCLEPLGVKESLLERECPILLPGFEPFRTVSPHGSDAES